MARLLFRADRLVCVDVLTTMRDCERIRLSCRSLCNPAQHTPCPLLTFSSQNSHIARTHPLLFYTSASQSSRRTICVCNSTAKKATRSQCSLDVVYKIQTEGSSSSSSMPCFFPLASHSPVWSVIQSAPLPLQRRYLCLIHGCTRHTARRLAGAQRVCGKDWVLHGSI